MVTQEALQITPKIQNRNFAEFNWISQFLFSIYSLSIHVQFNKSQINFSIRKFIQKHQMNFITFQKEAQNFKNRIIEAFKLIQDEGKLIRHKRTVTEWIRKKQQDLETEKKTQPTSNIIKAILQKTMIQEKKKKLEKQITLHQQLKTYIKTKTFEQAKNMQQFLEEEFFSQIKESLQVLLKNQVKEYYGFVKAPFIGNMYIPRKQDFRFCVENSPHHNLKFIVTQDKVAHKYQRNLVQEVFGRVIRKKGALSLMIKIEIDVLPDDKDIDIYCYIQDLSFKGQQFKQLSEVEIIEKREETYAFEFKTNQGQILQINKESLLQIFLSQMIVIPVQTLVSDFIIQVSKDGADIIKYHQGTRQEIGESTLLKDHPSIRNPLFYFRNYIAKNEIKLEEILKFNTKKIYGNFYCSLNIISKLIKNDFSFYLEQKKINSLCFNIQTFCNIWQIIHELVMISDWIEEVIRPIKQTVTIFEIINKFCPILTNMLTLEGNNFTHYRDHLLHLEADTFMANYVPKSSIQRYKDIYIPLNNYDDPNSYSNGFEVYEKIFSPIMDEFDLNSCDLYEASYFLNFVGENKNFNVKEENTFHPSWKNYQIWKEVYKLKEIEELPYINLYLDMVGFYLGIDTVQLTNRPFYQVKNQNETPQFLQDLEKFILWMITNYQKKYHNHLSILFQKAYRYKKYKICNLLLQHDILMSEFQDIFEFVEILAEEEQLEKERLSHNMKKKSPQMYRKLKWEELMRVTLREQDKDSVPVNAVKYGNIFIQRHIYEAMQIGEIQNNISRKDYMFDPDRRMIKVSFSQLNEAYIEFTQYPLVRYFYRLFLQKLNKAHLIPNFTALLTDHGVMLHLIESIPAGLNFQKGYNSFSEIDLKNLCDKDELSESIILSIILMPSKLQLKNIIAVPGDTPKNSIFMIDLKEFYRSHPIERNQGNYFLKSVNCLFTFDQMHKSISPILMKKYSNVEIMSFVQNLFVDLSKLIKTVNEMRSKIKQKNNDQLLGLIFEKNFIINLTQRLFKIQNCFQDCLQKKKSISHMDVLNMINPELSYFYQEIIKSSSSLLQREKNLLDDMWRKSFVNKNNMIEFFAPSAFVPEPLNIFPNHYRKFCFDGPTQNLNNLYNQSKKFVIYENNIEKLNPFHHQTLQYYVRNLDFSKLNVQQRKTAVNKLQQKSKEYLTKKGCLPLSVIKLQEVDVMKASQLNFAYERLKEVILENIKTNDLQLCTIFKMLESVLSIRAKNISGIISLGESFYLSSSLELRNLRTLSICQCPQLKSIDIKCDALENITVRDNPALETIYVNSYSLKNLDCTGSNKLKLQNIGLYILKGLNVLLSDIACDGYLKKLQDKSYSTYVFNILKFLLNRLKESQIKAIIITTLTKLKLLDQEIASTLLGVPSMSKVTNMLLKYNMDLQNKVYSKLVDLFFNNQMIECFVATDMNLTNIEQIATYIKENSKKYKKFFKQTKINQTIKNNFESFKTIFTFINLNKHCKLNLESLELDTDEEAMQLIDLLINQRQDLQKVDLVIQRCKISTNLFEVIFRRKNVVSLYISESVISNGISNSESLQNLKQLKIKNSLIHNFELLNKLDYLVVLEIENCELPQQTLPFYSSIGKKRNLKILKFTKQRPINKDINLQLLMDNLKELPILSILDLSNNSFNQDQLTLINQFTKKSSLEELILRDFYQKGQKYHIFSTFLRSSRLRELIIEFPLNEKQNLKNFIESLSCQKTILKLYLQTQAQVESEIFAPLNQNKTLNIIDSNQFIPTWLKKHLKSNKIEKSKISFANRNTGAEYDIFMAKESKFYDYHKLGLSMDGGGIRGLLIATELEYLATQVGYPLHKIFDVIGGTSIGGILALSIASTLDKVHPILSPPELKELFTVHGKEIFKKSQIRSITNLYDTKFSPAYIENLLNYYFKDCKLSDTLKQTNCIVTAVNRINNKDVIFKSTDAILNRDKDFYVKDIGRATSAAPTYFPSAQIKNLIASEKYSLVDGGMGMNNPSKLVIDQIKKMAFNSRNENNYFLLSLGTGRLPSQNIPEYAGIKDLAPIIDSFTESACYFTQRDLTQNYKGHFLRVSPLINLSKKQGQLDRSDPYILKTYQQTGLSAAKDFFSNTIIFGKYRTMSLVEWLRQNTQRKYAI